MNESNINPIDVGSNFKCDFKYKNFDKNIAKF